MYSLCTTGGRQKRNTVITNLSGKRQKPSIYLGQANKQDVDDRIEYKVVKGHKAAQMSLSCPLAAKALMAETYSVLHWNLITCYNSVRIPNFSRVITNCITPKYIRFVFITASISLYRGQLYRGSFPWSSLYWELHQKEVHQGLDFGTHAEECMKMTTVVSLKEL